VQGAPGSSSERWVAAHGVPPGRHLWSGGAQGFVRTCRPPSLPTPLGRAFALSTSSRAREDLGEEVSQASGGDGDSNVQGSLPAFRYVKHVDLKGERDMKTLARRCVQEGARMGRERVSQGLAQLERLWGSIEGEEEQEEALAAAALLFRRAKDESTGMRPKQLCLVLKAHARINGRGGDGAVVRCIERSALASVDAFSGHEAVRLLEAYAVMALPPRDELLTALCARLHASVSGLTARDAAAALWALARVGAVPGEDLLAFLEAQAVLCAGQWDARVVWRLLTSLEGLGGRPSGHLLDELALRLTDGSLSLGPRDVSAWLLLASRLGLHPEERFLEALRRLALSTAPSMDAQGVSNSLVALARIGGGGDEEDALVEALSARGAAVVESFKGSEMSAAMWALARMGLGGHGDAAGGLVAALCWRVAREPEVLDARGVGNFLWAYARQDMRPNRHMLSGLLRRTAALAPEMTPQSVANVLWSLAKLRLYRETSLVTGMCQRAVAVLDGSTRKGLLQIVWALGRLGVQPSEALLAALDRKILLHVQDFDLPSVMETLAAFTRMRVHPGEEVVEVLKARARHLIQQERDEHDV